MKKLLSIFSVILVCVFLAGSFSVIALGGDSSQRSVNNDIITFKIKGYENYDYANEVLSKLNKIRRDAGRKKLVMDKELLEVAMQRAAEVAVYYEHERPDGSSCFSIYTGGYGAMGENIASGQSSPQEVITSWKNSPGHYSNMISENFTRVGIGCYEASNGVLCWVQFFADSKAESVTRKGKIKTTRTIKADAKNLGIDIIPGNLDLKKASTGKEFNFVIRNYNVNFSYVCQNIVSSSFSFKSSDPKVIAIKDGTKGVVKGQGSTYITATNKSNNKVSFRKKLIVGHEHSYKLTSSTKKQNKCSTITTKIYKCTKCGAVNTKKETKTIHKKGKWIVEKKATVNAPGSKYRKCTLCKKIVERENIAQLKPATVKLSSIRNAITGIKITWNKTSGADKYTIYRKTGSSDYKAIKTVTSTSFIDTTAKGGTKYTYTVKAKNEAGYGSYNKNGLSCVFVGTPDPSVSNENGGVKVQWKKTSGAKGYHIYRKTANADSFVKIQTIISTLDFVSFVDEKVTDGVKYTYIVKAYNGDSVSSYYAKGKSIIYEKPQEDEPQEEPPVIPGQDFSDPEVALEMFREASLQINENSVAGYSKSTWQELQDFNMDGVISGVVRSVLEGFLTSEEDAEEHMYDKGSYEAGENMPKGNCLDSEIKNISTRKSGSNVILTIVMKDQKNPEEDDRSGLAVMAKDIVYPQDIHDAVADISVIKSVDKCDITYSDYTIEATINKYGQFVEIKHSTLCFIEASADFSIGKKDASTEIKLSSKYWDFEY